MPLPGDVSTRVVHGAWTDLLGNPRSGQVTFTPTAERFTSASTSTTITGTAVTAHLDPAGEIDLTLPVTDDPDLGGSPFEYRVTVALVGDEQPYAFWIALPTSGDVLELAEVTPILPSPTGGTVALSVNGETGHVALSAADVGADPAGTATAAVAAHTAAGDPHPQYLTSGEASGAYLPLAGGTLTGGLQLASTPDGGSDDYDSTSRIELTSHQSNGDHFFGELLRLNVINNPDGVGGAKGMIAWRLPRPPGDDDAGTLRSVTWMGAHWNAQDSLGTIHGHWSIETPDASDALRTRFEIKIANEAQTAIGSDKTLVMTNAADLVVRCDDGQVLRLKTGAGAVKAIEFANADWGGTGKRWQVRQNGTAESGSNAGSDFEIARYNDSGVQQDAPLVITRSTGRTIIGGTTGASSGLTVNRNSAGQALVVATTATGAIGYNHTAADVTSRTLEAQLAGDANRRLVILANGQLEWGGGSTARDVNLYRQAADVLRTDDALQVGGTLAVTGATTLSSTLTLAADPATAMQAATKQYVDAAASGGTPPLARLQRIADLTLTTGTVTAVPMATSLEQSGGTWWTTGANFTVPTGCGGLYAVSVIATFKNAGANTGERSVWVRKLVGGPLVDDPPIVAQTGVGPGGTGWPDITAADQARLVAGETYYVSVRHALGADVVLYQARVSLVRLAA